MLFMGEVVRLSSGYMEICMFSSIFLCCKEKNQLVKFLAVYTLSMSTVWLLVCKLCRNKNDGPREGDGPGQQKQDSQ